MFASIYIFVTVGHKMVTFGIYKH